MDGSNGRSKMKLVKYNNFWLYVSWCKVFITQGIVKVAASWRPPCWLLLCSKLMESGLVFHPDIGAWTQEKTGKWRKGSSRQRHWKKRKHRMNIRVTFNLWHYIRDFSMRALRDKNIKPISVRTRESLWPDSLQCCSCHCSLNGAFRRPPPLHINPSNPLLGCSNCCEFTHETAQFHARNTLRIIRIVQELAAPHAYPKCSAQISSRTERFFISMLS